MANGAVIEEVELSADGHAVGEARDAHAVRFDVVGDVMRRRLPIDSRVHGEDDFGDCALVYALNQGGDIEIFRADALQRGKCAAQNVIASAKSARAFHRPEIGDILHHAELCGVASLTRADMARVHHINIGADRAGLHTIRDREHCFCERAQKCVAFLDQRERGTAGGAWAEAGELGKAGDELFNLGTGHAGGR